ncbi:hypothetical protein HT031_005202 [Scenedesmus sp. PABB004]|nr:hypothetical protein HT031_005202 [Scenedesmus sp. PABB004]
MEAQQQLGAGGGGRVSCEANGPLQFLQQQFAENQALKAQLHQLLAQLPRGQAAAPPASGSRLPRLVLPLLPQQAAAVSPCTATRPLPPPAAPLRRQPSLSASAPATPGGGAAGLSAAGAQASAAAEALLDAQEVAAACAASIGDLQAAVAAAQGALAASVNALGQAMAVLTRAQAAAADGDAGGCGARAQDSGSPACDSGPRCAQGEDSQERSDCTAGMRDERQRRGGQAQASAAADAAAFQAAVRAAVAEALQQMAVPLGGACAAAPLLESMPSGMSVGTGGFADPGDAARPAGALGLGAPAAAPVATPPPTADVLAGAAAACSLLQERLPQAAAARAAAAAGGGGDAELLRQPPRSPLLTELLDDLLCDQPGVADGDDMTADVPWLLPGSTGQSFTGSAAFDAGACCFLQLGGDGPAAGQLPDGLELPAPAAAAPPGPLVPQASFSFGAASPADDGGAPRVGAKRQRQPAAGGGAGGRGYGTRSKARRAPGGGGGAAPSGGGGIMLSSLRGLLLQASSDSMRARLQTLIRQHEQQARHAEGPPGGVTALP